MKTSELVKRLKEIGITEDDNSVGTLEMFEQAGNEDMVEVALEAAVFNPILIKMFEDYLGNDVSAVYISGIQVTLDEEKEVHSMVTDHIKFEAKVKEMKALGQRCAFDFMKVTAYVDDLSLKTVSVYVHPVDDVQINVALESLVLHDLAEERWEEEMFGNA